MSAPPEVPPELRPLGRPLEHTSTGGDSAPVFEEQWHAQVLGVANTLVATGAFSASEWSEALGAALAERKLSDANVHQIYYESVLQAIETLLNVSGQVQPSDLDGRTEAWRQAYLRTPHGQPVTLARE